MENTSLKAAITRQRVLDLLLGNLRDLSNSQLKSSLKRALELLSYQKVRALLYLFFNYNYYNFLNANDTLTVWTVVTQPFKY